MFIVYCSSGWCEPRREEANREAASRSSQLYSEHQTIYIVRIRKSHLSYMYNHKDKPHMAQSYFSIEAYE